MNLLVSLLGLLLTDGHVCEVYESDESGLRLVGLGPDCSARVASPDKKLVLEISETGRASILATNRGAVLSKRLQLEGPYLVGWSPSSQALLINEGQGSGQTSDLLLGTLKNGRFQFDTRPHKEIVRRFRNASRCSPD
jgi:hypothetical protein